MFVPLQADDTYMQLKKDLEYLDLKVRWAEFIPKSLLVTLTLLLKLTHLLFPTDNHF